MPYTDNLPFLFFGEEIQMAVRAWCKGWDFFAPGETLLFHLYTRSYRKTFKELMTEDMTLKQQQSEQLVKRYLGIQEPLIVEPGQKRTIRDYEVYCGLHFQTAEATEAATNGGLAPTMFLDYLLNMVMSFT